MSAARQGKKEGNRASMSATTEKSRVGFIGLGIMGRPMARNLLAAGYPVTVWARREGPAKELEAAGASVAESPCSLARRSDVVITMVTDSPDVEAVILGPDGVLEGAAAGLTVIDMSTIAPEAARRIGAALQARGVAFLDAPVTGGDVGARNATLSIMVGGDPAVFARCFPLFQAMGKTITHVGPVGAGQAVKLCNQVVSALNLLGVCEALVFGQKMGVDLERMLTVLGNGAASSWLLQALGPKILRRDFSPGFMVKLHQKDLRLVQEAAAETHTPMLGVALVQQLYRAVEAAGGGEQGMQALVQALETLANTTVGRK
ncbi:MAG: NAD(P)-dependent oxidoreductase [Armatimonadota bacterium]|nr:NAD(P)-dependent oxidoreductase [Armatimonadota bacterium]